MVGSGGLNPAMNSGINVLHIQKMRDIDGNHILVWRDPRLQETM